MLDQGMEMGGRWPFRHATAAMLPLLASLALGGCWHCVSPEALVGRVAAFLAKPGTAERGGQLAAGGLEVLVGMLRKVWSRAD